MNNLEQRSEEWFQWRNKGIGSSEAGILMGVNNYRGVVDLWLEKTGQIVKKQIVSEDIQRGIDNEDKALKLYVEKTGFHMEPLTFEHPKFNFLRASLDGGNNTLKKLIEIKCPREHNHIKTKKHHYIKPEYVAQMQHQFIVTKFTSGDFLSYFQEELIIIPVEPDYEYMGELLAREILFWEHVTNQTEPSPLDFLAWNKPIIYG